MHSITPCITDPFQAMARALKCRSQQCRDPGRGSTIELPPDRELLADLTAPRWSVQGGRIKIESKDEIIKRIGRSPDCADAVVLANVEVENPLACDEAPAASGGRITSRRWW